MKYETLAVIAFCVVTFGGLGYLFVSLTDGVNKPIGTASTNAAVSEVTLEPPAGPLVDDDAPVVLGSPSVTTNAAQDELKVNFNECAAGSGTLETESGSVVINMQGIEGNDCVVGYQTADDNAICRVPASLGIQRFRIANDVPNFGTIERYCEAA
jgi:hypothetical protein